MVYNLFRHSDTAFKRQYNYFFSHDETFWLSWRQKNELAMLRITSIFLSRGSQVSNVLLNLNTVFPSLSSNPVKL